MKRLIYLDYIKIIAIFCVVMCHIPMLWKQDMMGNLSIGWYISNAIGILGVPLFMMVTGVLILQKDLSNKKNIIRFYKKNLFSIYITGVIWNVFYYLFKNEPLSVKDLIKTVLLINKPETHLWYIRMIVAYYIFMPLISYLLNRYRKTFWVAVTVIGMMTFGINGVRILVFHSPVPTTSGISISCYLVYMALGHYLMKKEHSINYSFCVLSIISILAVLVVFRIKAYFIFLWYDNPLVLVAATAFFLLLKKIFADKPINTIITQMSTMTFGVYLCHIVFMRFFGNILIPILKDNIIIEFILIYVLTLSMSFLFIKAFKLLPPPSLKTIIQMLEFQFTKYLCRVTRG